MHLSTHPANWQAHQQSAGDTTAIQASQWRPVWHRRYRNWPVTIGPPCQARGKLLGDLAADKAALVNLLSRRVSLQQRISLVQCMDTAGLECLAQVTGQDAGKWGPLSGQDVGQHIQVSSTTLKCTVQHSTASYKWSLAGSGRYSLSVPGARHRLWDQRSPTGLGGPGQWVTEPAWRVETLPYSHYSIQ